MAQPELDAPIGGPKFPNEVNEVRTSSNGLSNQEEGNAREGDYDVDTVERVYRYLRLINPSRNTN